MRLGWRLATLRNGLQDATAYRIEFLFEILGAAFVPAAVQITLWYAMFKVGGATEVHGQTFLDLLNYTITSVLFTQIRGGDLDFEVQEMIRSGQLSNYLLRPIGFLEFIYIRGLAPKLFIASLCLGAGILMSPWVQLSPGRLFGSMLLALIGNIIHFQISCALAATAFYWEEGYAILMVKNMLVSFLSGELVPLNLFPESAHWIWKSFPFYLYVFGPTQYALGKWTHAEFLMQLGFACIWLLIGWAMIKITWSFGLKKYLSLGG